jgi:hypothetical protein
MSESTKELFGVCQADLCKRGERAITDEGDKVTFRGKDYHKECAPTPGDIERMNNSYT